MIVTVEKIMKDVRVAIDMNDISDALLVEGDVDTLQLDETIKSKIEDGVRLTHMEAPAHLLEWGHTLPGSTAETEKQKDEADGTEKVENAYGNLQGFEGTGISWKGPAGRLILPDDFMRLIVFEMDDWEMPVYDALDARDPAVNIRLHSRYGGISGTPQNPNVAICQRPEGLTLEFYGCESTKATISQGVYLPYPVITDRGIDVCRKCYRAAVYRIAALTLSTLGDQQAETLTNLSKSLLV